MINLTYCDFRFKTEEIIYISLQQGMGVNSQRWNVPHVSWFTLPNMILKITSNETTCSKFQHRRGVTFQLLNLNP